MTYVVVARWRPKDGEEAKLEGILRELTIAARNEPGCLEFIVNRSNDDPKDFLLYEQYADKEAFDVGHRGSSHFKSLVLEQSLPILAQREVKTYSILE